MAIRLSDLEQASRSFRASVAKSLNEAKLRGIQTAFLCHSHEDKKYAEGLQNYFQEQGWNLYIDWQDSSLPSKPDATTAAKIKAKIREMSWFLFLATPNSTSSRWCPWEIGFADAVKNHSNLVVIPTIDRSGNNHGNEYLQLYRHVALAAGGGYILLNPGQDTGTRLSYIR